MTRTNERGIRWGTSAARASLVLGLLLLPPACGAPAESDWLGRPPVRPGPALPNGAVSGGDRGTGDELLDQLPEIGADAEAVAGELLLPPLEDDAAAPSTVTIDRLVRSAGRAPLSGLPAVRAARRAEETAAALETLALELDTKRSGETWYGRLVRIAQTPPGRRDDLWCAVARATGRIGRYEFAPVLAAALDAPARYAVADGEGRADRALDAATLHALALRREAAQQALHALYGRWFDTSLELEPFVALVRPSPATSLLLAETAREEKRGRQRLAELLRYEPDSAVQWLGDPDPLVRAAAARVLQEALVSSAVERQPVYDALLARLEVELDPRPYHAVLGALCTMLGSEAPDSPEVARVRSLLVEPADDERALAVAHALARLPWRVEEPEDAAHLLTGARTLGDLLAELTRESYSDPDPILETLLSLETLADQAESAGLAEALKRSPARESVIRLLGDPNRTDVVRVAAAETFGAFALLPDGPDVIAVLHEGEASPTLGHALLGVLRNVLASYQADTPGLDSVLAEVADLTAADDPDLRRRALGMIADESLARLVTTLPLDFLAERFATEEVPDLSLTIVSLLTRYGRPSMLEVCLAARRFDELASNPESLAPLTEMCAVLADGDPEATMIAAVRLVGVESEATRLTRVRDAVALVRRLQPEEAAELSREDHRLVCAWSWRLHVSGVVALVPTGRTLAFAQQLVDLHWPRAAVAVDAVALGAESEPDFDEAARHHLLAVALAALSRAEGATVRMEEVEKAYARALRAAPSHAIVGFPARVRRDRARFRFDVGESVGALTDYRELVAQGELDFTDLRRTIELLNELEGASSRRTVAPEVFERTFTLVQRPEWRSEPAPVRLGDLELCFTSAIQSTDVDTLRRFAALLEDLPAPAEDGVRAEPRPDDDGRLWAGLDQGEDLTALRSLRDRARASLPSDASAAEPVTGTPLNASGEPDRGTQDGT